MSQIETISVARLAIGLLPAVCVVGLLARWSLPVVEPLLALGRMLLQLFLLGFALVFLFRTDHPLLVLAVCGFMVFASGWIAIRTLPDRNTTHFLHAILAIGIGGGLTLALTTQCVLQVEPWYAPRYIIPLSGMIFSNAMNAVSLAAERLHAERQRGEPFLVARNLALRASFLPLVNSLLAVGLVSIPGMMTGQVLLGADPANAARYQMMVMSMIFSSAGLATIVYLWLREKA